jgi:uncharacterized protein
MQIHTILWRRVDNPGHDACRLLELGDAWRLEGTAVFRQEGVPACLTYKVDCDANWRTREGVVHGWVGTSPLDLRITRADGMWTLNGQVVPQLDGCADLDIGFTPATNLIQLRRIALQVGDAVEVPVAWLDATVGILDRLQQRYERRSEELYWYEAPRFDYFALLQVSAIGFVEKYPNLWEAEP